MYFDIIRVWSKVKFHFNAFLKIEFLFPLGNAIFLLAGFFWLVRQNNTIQFFYTVSKMFKNTPNNLISYRNEFQCQFRFLSSLLI